MYLCELAWFCGAQALPVSPEHAKALVLRNGTMVFVDSTFSDWFGFKSSELTGQNLGSVLVEIKQLDE